MIRRYLRIGTLLAAGMVATLAVGMAIGCGPGTTRYIALGDSIAEGRGATDQERLDYVGLFNEFYEKDHTGPERLTTYQQESETSASIMANQVANAVQVIGDDETDIGELTAALESDPGEEQLLVTTYYNPYKGTGSPFELPTDGIFFGTDGTIDCAANATDPTKAGLNDMITCFSAAAGATTVDLYSVMTDKTLTPTHIATGDIHPNDSGYRLIADAVIAAYKAGK